MSVAVAQCAMPGTKRPVFLFLCVDACLLDWYVYVNRNARLGDRQMDTIMKRRALLIDHGTGARVWFSHAYVSAIVASDPFRYHGEIGRDRAPLLRDPFTGPHHIQIEDCHYPQAV